MNVGVWAPGGVAKNNVLDADLVAKLLNCAQEAGDKLTSEALREHQLESAQWLMTLELEAWTLANALSSQDLVQLIRFFTLVEAQISGWDAGASSPVIPLVKLLKAREAFDPALRKWIKAHTDNRYLPYGSAL